MDSDLNSVSKVETVTIQRKLLKHKKLNKKLYNTKIRKSDFENFVWIWIPLCENLNMKYENENNVRCRISEKNLYTFGLK